MSEQINSIFKRPEQMNSRRENRQNSYNIIELAGCNVEKENIEEILKNPLKCGYLLAFCESEYCAENIRYIVEIDRFRDSLSVDRDSWNSGLDWNGIDDLLGYHLEDGLLSEAELKSRIADNELIIGQESLWPSKYVRFDSVSHDIDSIWKKFLSHHAPDQICMPSRVLINTRRRLENVHLYGGCVFDQTILDPMKTLKKDTLPRFLVSSYYQRLQKRLNSLLPLPGASELVLPLPNNAPTTNWEFHEITNDNLYKISMIDVLHDKILYANFLTYCKSIYSDENLLCCRAIVLFKGYYTNHNLICPAEAQDVAWLIFRFFAAPGSIFEVSLSHRRRKDLMLCLANPKRDMFFRMEDSAIQTLRVHWNNFAKTSAFHQLPALLLEEKKMLQALENSSKPAPVRKSNSLKDMMTATGTGIMSMFTSK